MKGQDAGESELLITRNVGMLVRGLGNTFANCRGTYWRPQGGFGTFPEIMG